MNHPLNYSRRFENIKRDFNDTLPPPPPPSSPPPPLNTSKLSPQKSKTSPSYQQIHQRVVNGLYIDTANMNVVSPIKNYKEDKLKYTPTVSSRSQSPIKLQSQLYSHLHPHSQLSSSNISRFSPSKPLNSPDQLYRQNQMNNNQSPLKTMKTPSRQAPTIPNADSRMLKSSNRREPPPINDIPLKSSGASRGPQYYRELMLTASKNNEIKSSSFREQHQDTTTDMYLFSPSQSQDSPSFEINSNRSNRSNQNMNNMSNNSNLNNSSNYYYNSNSNSNYSPSYNEYQRYERK